VTYGSHGWHPHIHALFLLSGGDLWLLPELEQARYRDYRVAMLELDFWLRWRGIVESLGGVVDHRAFDVRGTDYGVSDYVTKFGRLPSQCRPSFKWGVEDELAKMSVKRGRGSSFSPFELLAMAGAGDQSAGVLFQEYARTMKGKRHLRWSKGLRARVGLGREKGVDELVSDDDKKSDVLALLSRDEWDVVKRNRARGEVLRVAASGDVDELVRFLQSLSGWDAAHSGVVRLVAGDDLEASRLRSVLGWERGL